MWRNHERRFHQIISNFGSLSVLNPIPKYRIEFRIGVQMVSASTAFLNFKTFHLNQLSFFFQFAHQCSSFGLLSCIITKKFQTLSELHLRPFNVCPEKLEYIVFMYFSSRTEVLDWCRNIQECKIKPNILLVNGFEDFCSEGLFEAVELSAALHDATNFLSSSNRHKFCHLVISFAEESLTKVSLLTLFANVFIIELHEKDTIARLIYPKDEDFTLLKLCEEKDILLDGETAHHFLTKVLKI